MIQPHEKSDGIDAHGAAWLVGFSALMAFGQIVIKVVHEGLQPVFTAGLRSAGALLILIILMCLRHRYRRLSVPRTAIPALGLMGLAFSAQFMCLYLALDRTDVSRASVIFYSMPIWMALGGHLFLRCERLTANQIAGLGLAFLGVAWAIIERPAGNGPQLLGDLLALTAAIFWAAIGLLARGPAGRAEPEVQLTVQLSISAALLLIISPAFGPLIRAPSATTWAGMLFQIGIVASFGFLIWMRLLRRYSAVSVASFSFLAPIFGVLFGVVILGEELDVAMVSALGLVVVGIILSNWVHPFRLSLKVPASPPSP